MLQRYHPKSVVCFQHLQKHAVKTYNKAIELNPSCYKFAFEGATKSKILKLAPEIEVDLLE